MAIGADTKMNAAVEEALHNAGFSGRCFIASKLDELKAELLSTKYDLVLYGGGLPKAAPEVLAHLQEWMPVNCPDTRTHLVSLADFKDPATSTPVLNAVAVAKRLLSSQ